jgi:hypothetical protein
LQISKEHRPGTHGENQGRKKQGNPEYKGSMEHHSGNEPPAVITQ